MVLCVNKANLTKHNCTHTLAHTLAHTHTHTHVHTHIHTQTCTHRQSHTQSLTYTHANTNNHTRIHLHAYAHISYSGSAVRKSTPELARGTGHSGLPSPQVCVCECVLYICFHVCAF
jgi:PhoPQ-activated pathogenicity-related protein